jgi:hypothetical protein
VKMTSNTTQNWLSAFVSFVSRHRTQKARNSHGQPAHFPFLVVLTLGMVAANHSLANAAQLEVNGSAPHLCASTSGGLAAAGTPVIAFSCSGAFWQQWQYSNGQIYSIGTTGSGPMCLDLEGGPGQRTPAVINPCNGNPNQFWYFDGSLIFNAGSRLCLDSSGGQSVGGGTQLVIQDCYGGTSQDWSLRPAQLEVNGSAPHLCASTSGGSAAAGTPVIAYSCSGAFWQQWEYSNGQIYSIGTTGSGSMCLDLEGGGTTAGSPAVLWTCDGQVTQQWLLNLNGAIINQKSGLCLDSSASSDSTSPSDGTQLVTNKCNGGTSQSWNVR